MKNLFSILFLTAVLTACSTSEERTGEPEENPLTGRWKLSSKTLNGSNVALSTCENDYNWYQFNSDLACQKGVFNMYSVGSTLYCNQLTGNYTYEYNSNEFTMTNSQIQEKYYLVEVNSITLKVKKFYTKILPSGPEVNIPTNQQVLETCIKQ